MPPSHVIFDFDGVLIDSEAISMEIDQALLAACNVAIPSDEMHRRFVGKTFSAMVRELEAEHRFKLPADLEARKDLAMLERYHLSLRPIAGVIPMLENLPQPCSIATNGPRARALEALRITGLDRYFQDRVTTFEDVAEAKPKPDIYLLAAERAGQSPSRCLVVEDSVTGATAALAAGCVVVGFTGAAYHRDSQVQKLAEIGVQHIISDMAGLLPLMSTITA